MKKKFLIEGFGSIGKKHAKNLVKLGHEVSVLIKPSSKVGTDISFRDVFYNSREVNFNDFDGYIICTPTALHLGGLEKTVKYKIPTLVEKPISHNYKGIGKLSRSIYANKIPVMVGFNFRYHLHIKKIKEVISMNKLGKLLYANFWWNDDIRNWYPNGRYVKNYSSQAKLGGGALLTMSHEIDFACWLIDDVIAVYGELFKLSNLEMHDVEDFFFGILYFKSGAHCTIQTDFITKVPSRGMRICGESGSIQWDYFNGALEIKIDNDELYYSNMGKISDEVKNEMYLEEIRDFIKMTEGKIESPIPYEDGVKVQYIISKLVESSKTKTTEKLI